MSYRHVRVVVDGQKFISTGGYNCDHILKSLILNYPELYPLPDRFEHASKNPKDARGALEQFCNLNYYFPELWEDDQIHCVLYIFIKRCGNHDHRSIERIIQFNVTRGNVISMDDLILKPNAIDKSDPSYTEINQINMIDINRSCRFMLSNIFVLKYVHHLRSSYKFK